jgi:hypothetical protein
VSALATWMSTWWLMSMNTMWVPVALPAPWVIAAPFVDSKPTHMMKLLGVCNKLTWPTPGTPVVVLQPMTSTDLLVAGVIGALFAPAARLYVMKAAFGVVMVCVAFATARHVMIATKTARSMAAHREDFWTRISTVFILFVVLFLVGFLWLFSSGRAWALTKRGITSRVAHRPIRSLLRGSPNENATI